MLRNAALSILLLSVLLLIGCGRTREAQQGVQAAPRFRSRPTKPASRPLSLLRANPARSTPSPSAKTSTLPRFLWPSTLAPPNRAVRLLKLPLASTSTSSSPPPTALRKSLTSTRASIPTPRSLMSNMTSVAVQQSKDEADITIILIEQK